MSLRRNITCAPTFSSSRSSAGNARPPKSPVTSATADFERPGSLPRPSALMRFTAAFVVASVIAPSAGAGRAPIEFSRPAISAVTAPCRTAVSNCLNSSSCCRWMVVSSKMRRSASSQTFASKNHIDL